VLVSNDIAEVIGLVRIVVGLARELAVAEELGQHC
jgi:hypothetical protein